MSNVAGPEVTTYRYVRGALLALLLALAISVVAEISNNADAAKLSW